MAKRKRQTEEFGGDLPDDQAAAIEGDQVEANQAEAGDQADQVEANDQAGDDQATRPTRRPRSDAPPCICCDAPMVAYKSTAIKTYYRCSGCGWTSAVPRGVSAGELRKESRRLSRDQAADEMGERLGVARTRRRTPPRRARRQE